MVLQICLAMFMMSASVFAAELKGIKFDDTMKVDGAELKLNALGFRRVEQFGIPVKVYIGAFYVKKPSKERVEILKSERPVFFRMAFLLSVDKEKLVDGWHKAFETSCKPHCDAARPALKEFTNLISDVRSETSSTMKITKDGIEAEMGGKDPKKATIKNKAFADAFMQIFFGDEVIDRRLTKELLNGVD